MRSIHTAAVVAVLLTVGCSDARESLLMPEDPVLARTGGVLRFTSIDVPGAVFTNAYSINASGQIVGDYSDGTRIRGYLLRRGAFTTLEFPGSVFTSAWGINARGDIVGRYRMAADPRIYGFLLKDGVYSDISSSEHLHTMPTGIGASGEIVGCIHGTDFLNDMRGYVQRDGQMTLFEDLPSTMHNGVTAGGKVVVGLSYEASDIIKAYVIDRGVYTEFAAPGAAITQAWDVNQSGEVVGAYFDGETYRGFLRNQAGLSTVEFPGAAWTRAFGINAAGDLVGAYAKDGIIRGYIASRSVR
jgi:uncharacterized membrane protein